VLSVFVVVSEFPLQAEKIKAAAIMGAKRNFFIKLFLRLMIGEKMQNIFHARFIVKDRLKL
jgi:hypothetical protein